MATHPPINTLPEPGHTGRVLHPITDHHSDIATFSSLPKTGNIRTVMLAVAVHDQSPARVPFRQIAQASGQRGAFAAILPVPQH
jgi:hypothetical protein